VTVIGSFGLSKFFVVIGFNCPKDITPTNNAHCATFFIHYWNTRLIALTEKFMVNSICSSAIQSPVKGIEI
jgi:hypothetical protein|tara:strand:+ start:239 stop:451 length:213 start_codon:yes stop_codon:yes gene_type:complete